MTLDTRTLFLADVVIALAVAVALHVYRYSQKTYPGFESWVSGTWAMAVGYLALALRGPLPEVLSIFLVNLALSLAGVLRWHGTVRFTGGQGVSRAAFVVPLGVAVLCAWPSPLSESVIARSAVGTGTVAVFATLIGLRFIRRAPVRSLAYWALGVLHIVFAAALIARMAFWFQQPSVGIFDSSLFHSAFFLGVIGFEVMWGIGFAMMNGNRLEVELLASKAELAASVERLQGALADVRTLTGLLPLCCSCKRVRDDEGYWNQIESYLRQHSNLQVSHGLCPECAHRLYPDYFPHTLDVTPDLPPPAAAK